MTKKHKEHTYLSINHLFRTPKDVRYLEQWVCSKEGIEEIEKWEKKNSKSYDASKFAGLKADITPAYSIDLPNWLNKTGSVAIRVVNNNISAVESIAYKIEEFLLKHYNPTPNTSFDDAMKRILKGKN